MTYHIESYCFFRINKNLVMKFKSNLWFGMRKEYAHKTKPHIVTKCYSQKVSCADTITNTLKNNEYSTTSHFFGIKRISNILLIILTFPLCTSADERDPLHAIAGISREYDNNLFLLESGKQSDRITKAYAGIQLDKLYSLQRFKVNYTLNSARYQRNSRLNFNSHNYDAAWLWSLTPRLTGTLYADRKESLNSFQDFRNFNTSTIRNIRVSQTQHFEADYSPHGVWHLLGGITRNEATNSADFVQQDSFSAVALDGGVRYDFRSGSSIVLMAHKRNGDFGRKTPNFASLFDTGYNEKEAEARLIWLLSGHSRLNIRTAYLRRNHDTFSQRDYSGMEGRIDYFWTPTGKLQLGVSANTSLASFWNIDSSYTRENTLSISPIYKISDKIRLTGFAGISERRFLGDAVVPSTNRLDKARNFSAGIDWTPWRTLTLGADLRYSKRDSNIVGFDFTDTIVGIDASFLF
jgi:exopolysaccharide biosynthesis operon protein EpsL